MKPLVIATLLVACLAVAGDTNSDRASNAADAFARLKTLVGDWETDAATAKAQGNSHLTYELIAGGTALLERFSSEKMPTMLTVYYLDGNRLLLTHYCMAGNQPRMQARPFHPETGDLEFQFLDATNLASPGAGHMHSVRIHFVDKNRLVNEWQFYENGERKFTETAQYARVQ